MASPLDALSSFDLTELDLGTVYEQISEVDLGLFSEIVRDVLRGCYVAIAFIGTHR